MASVLVLHIFRKIPSWKMDVIALDKMDKGCVIRANRSRSTEEGTHSPKVTEEVCSRTGD